MDRHPRATNEEINNPFYVPERVRPILAHSLFDPIDMKLRFMSFASGSSGNSYYVGTERYGILIDAGVAARTLRKHLRDVGIGIETIRAIFITHDHADHIKGLAGLGERLHIPVYATALTHKGISRSYCMTEKLTTSARTLEKGHPMQLEYFCIESFEVPHDGTDNVGYCIEADGRTIVFLTDLGHITDTAAAYIARANYLVIEANYDPEMLRMGPYPPYLKGRIASNTGHMSNADTADFLATHYPAGLRHIWLCHLSRENNHPDLAVKTVELRLKEQGIIAGQDVQLTALKRMAPSEMYELA